MQYLFAFVVIAAITGLTDAQTVPNCTQNCVAVSVSKVTSCSQTDIACHCLPANYASILADANPCIQKACSTADVLAFQAAVAAICGAFTSSSPITPTTSAPLATTSSAPVTSSAVDLTNVIGPPTVTVFACRSTTTASQAVPNANANSTSSASIAQYTGAAGRAIVSLGSAVGLAIAALAAL